MNRSRDRWAARVRRAWIERACHARGSIQRRDVMAAFDVSEAQASADIQALLEEHPGCLRYDLRGKCYRWEQGVTPRLEIPSPIIALALGKEGEA